MIEQSLKSNILSVKIIPEFIDATNAGLLKNEFKNLSVANLEVRVDISRVDFIDSSGIGALLSLFKSVRAAKGTFTLVQPTASVLSILELLRLQRLFEIECSS